MAYHVWTENSGGCWWFETAVARRGKVSLKAAAEKFLDTEKFECACEKTRLELEQVEKFQEHCKDLRLIHLPQWRTYNTLVYWRKKT